MAGRGTRVLPGVVDHILGQEGAAGRRAAVASSAKPDCMILDFVGNAGKHSLVSPEDLLGGSYTDAEVELAKKKAKESPGGDAKKRLEAARAELQRVASQLRAKVTSHVSSFDPFAVFHVQHDGETTRFGYKPMSAPQHDALKRMGLHTKEIEGLSKYDAGKLLSTAATRRTLDLATFKQLKALQRNGVTDVNISFKKANDVLNYIFGQRRTGAAVDPSAVDGILHRQRESGED